MNDIAPWLPLFSHSEFFAIKKTEALSPFLQSKMQKIAFDPAVNNYHPDRKAEFLLGRVCASLAHEQLLGQELNQLFFNSDRSPLWPQGVVGSLSHSKQWVGAAVAKSSDLIGIGIDFEVMGRTKLELASHIRTSDDIISHPKLSGEELLTLIFSCKESLYKALYPSVQKFFGFDAAAVREIDFDNGLFTIDLLTQLSLNFGPNSIQRFEGRFTVENKNCLTVLEISRRS